MNQTQLIIMVATLVLLNFIWGLSSNKSDSDIQQSSTEVKLERSSTEITFYTVVLIIPLALCLWMTNIWFTAYNKSVQAADWEVISAKIIDKQVKTATISGNTVNNNVRGSNYIPYIEYEYTFKGIPYTSTTFSFLKQTEYYEEYDVEEYLSKFPDINQKIKIYVRAYKDEFGVNKSESTLRVGTQDIEYLGVTTTSLISLFCIIVIRLLYS